MRLFDRRANDIFTSEEHGARGSKAPRSGGAPRSPTRWDRYPGRRCDAFIPRPGGNFADGRCNAPSGRVRFIRFPGPAKPLMLRALIRGGCESAPPRLGALYV